VRKEKSNQKEIPSHPSYATMYLQAVRLLLCMSHIFSSVDYPNLCSADRWFSVIVMVRNEREAVYIESPRVVSRFGRVPGVCRLSTGSRHTSRSEIPPVATRLVAGLCRLMCNAGKRHRVSAGIRINIWRHSGYSVCTEYWSILPLRIYVPYRTPEPT